MNKDQIIHDLLARTKAVQAAMHELNQLTMDIRLEAMKASQSRHLDGEVKNYPPAPLRDGYEQPVMTESYEEAVKMWRSCEFDGWDAIDGDSEEGVEGVREWVIPENDLLIVDPADYWDVYAFYKKKQVKTTIEDLFDPNTGQVAWIYTEDGEVRDGGIEKIGDTYFLNGTTLQFHAERKHRYAFTPFSTYEEATPII